MDAKQIIEILSDNDIWQILTDLNASPIDNGDNFECQTVCHHGNSSKLYYYKESKLFYCYTHCGSMNIFNFIMNAKKYEFKDAILYISKKFNIGTTQHFEGFSSAKVENPGELLNNKLKEPEEIVYNKLDKSILNDFYDFYHKLWIDDHITTTSMRKFNIKYNILENQIIIPHYNSDNDLIGVRARNLNNDLVEDGKKYLPIYYDNKVLKHATGGNLYGLNKNKEAIENKRKCILFESEKSVMQLESYYPGSSIGLCLSGSSLTTHQLKILKKLNIEEVVIGLDKEFDEIGDDREVFFAKRIEKVFGNKLKPFFRVSVLWDTNNILEKKDSPTDKGREIFDELYKNRIYLIDEEIVN